MTTSVAQKRRQFLNPLVAGGIAGTCVDLSLYPVDTLKTRLQAAQGFRAAGGFRGIYAGVGSAALGAAPGAALFFVVYEASKKSLEARHSKQRTSVAATFSSGSSRQDGAGRLPTAETALGNDSAGSRRQKAMDHMIAASAGEAAACAVRVPTEVVKQRAQTKQAGSSWAALQAILVQTRTIGISGVARELYRGAGITVMREVPFTMIQFPLWEACKAERQRQTGLGSISPLDSAVAGSLAGAAAAAATTPLDVLKTRLMLAPARLSSQTVIRSILVHGGPRAFFAGMGPRMLWIAVGGFVFLGSYQVAFNALQDLEH